MPLDHESNTPSTQLQGIAKAILSLVLLIVFVAGGTQVIISPKRVTTWLEKAFEKEDIPANIDFEAAQMSFTGNLWPLFGVRLRNLKISVPDEDSNFLLESPYILIPLSLRSLLGEKELNLGKIRAYKLSISSGKTSTLSSQAFLDQTLLSLWKIFSQGLSVSESFDGLYVEDLVYKLNSERIFHFKKWRYDPQQAEIRFEKLFLDRGKASVKKDKSGGSIPELLLESSVLFPKEAKNPRSPLAMAIGKYHLNLTKEKKSYTLSGLQGEADLYSTISNKSFEYVFKGHLKSELRSEKLTGSLKWTAQRFVIRVEKKEGENFKPFINHTEKIPYPIEEPEEVLEHLDDHSTSGH